jgi:hypothetical protein
MKRYAMTAAIAAAVMIAMFRVQQIRKVALGV